MKEQQPQVVLGPGEHEVRVERGRSVYTVRAVKRALPLVDLMGTEDLAAWLVMLLPATVWVVLVERFWPSWKIGVVWRETTWPAGAERVIYKRRLAPDADRDDEVARLARDAEAGRFDNPSSSFFRRTTYRSSERI